MSVARSGDLSSRGMSVGLDGCRKEGKQSDEQRRKDKGTIGT